MLSMSGQSGRVGGESVSVGSLAVAPATLPVASAPTGARLALALRQLSARLAVGWRGATQGAKFPMRHFALRLTQMAIRVNPNCD